MHACSKYYISRRSRKLSNWAEISSESWLILTESTSHHFRPPPHRLRMPETYLFFARPKTSRKLSKTSPECHFARLLRLKTKTQFVLNCLEWIRCDWHHSNGQTGVCSRMSMIRNQLKIVGHKSSSLVIWPIKVLSKKKSKKRTHGLYVNGEIIIATLCKELKSVYLSNFTALYDRQGSWTRRLYPITAEEPRRTPRVLALGEEGERAYNFDGRKLFVHCSIVCVR